VQAANLRCPMSLWRRDGQIGIENFEPTSCFGGPVYDDASFLAQNNDAGPAAGINSLLGANQYSSRYLALIETTAAFFPTIILQTSGLSIRYFTLFVGSSAVESLVNTVLVVITLKRHQLSLAIVTRTWINKMARSRIVPPSQQSART